MSTRLERILVGSGFKRHVVGSAKNEAWVMVRGFQENKLALTLIMWYPGTSFVTLHNEVSGHFQIPCAGIDEARQLALDVAKATRKES